MFNHVAVFRFVETAADGQIDAVTEGLSALPGLIEEIVSYRVGRDLGAIDGTWDYAVVAEFADQRDYEAYADHPAHVAVVEERIRPILEQLVRVQFET